MWIRNPRWPPPQDIGFKMAQQLLFFNVDQKLKKSSYSRKMF
jgi:hypothetical protein